MEKIEKALEEARKEQQTGPLAYREDAVSNGPTSIRTVPVDPDALVKRRVIAGPCGTYLTDSYKVLRTQIDQKSLKGSRSHALMVTSSVDGEGKTLTALNLAISFSQQIDRAVILVEADLRSPSLQQLLDLDPTLPGLADHLLDRRPIDELLLQINLDRLAILPAGRSVLNSPELLGSQRMKDLMLELRRRFSNRLLIFDTPPVLASADALVFSELADSIVLVVEAEKTPVEKINKARELLQGKNLMGLILNKAR